MKASEFLRHAIESVERESSPWRPELLKELNHIMRAIRMHESWVGYTPPPRQTALGHKPQGVTVAGHSVQTDAALSALECSD